jgi:hypothetical protein
MGEETLLEKQTEEWWRQGWLRSKGSAEMKAVIVAVAVAVVPLAGAAIVTVGAEL